MKTAILAIGMMLSATACALSAQQQSMPDMPGMNMPQQSQPAKLDKTDNGKQQSMPDMPTTQGSKTTPPAKAGKPNRDEKPPETMPKDMQGMSHDSGNQKVQQNAASEENSVQQQARQANQKPGAGSDQQSIQIPAQELQ